MADPEPVDHECVNCGILPCDCAEVFGADDACMICSTCAESIMADADECEGDGPGEVD